MKIVFMGNPEFALPALRALRDGPHSLLAVVTSPDKPQGRGRKLLPLPAKTEALKFGLQVLSPASLRDEEFLIAMTELNPDAFVVAAFRILPKELFTIPRFGSINIHPSLLPRGRGPAPIQWTLLRGETETGVSIMQLTEKIDGGGILAQERITVKPEDDFGILHDKLSEMGTRMLLDVLERIERGDKMRPIMQDESKVTSAPKLSTREMEINWERSAEYIVNQVRAFGPTPGAFTRLDGEILKVIKATSTGVRTLTSSKLEVREGLLFAGTSTEDLQLNRVKPAGKKAMQISDFLRGCRKLPDELG